MRKKILFIISLVFSFIFVSSGLNKFLFFVPDPENMPQDLAYLINSLRNVGWIMPLLGIMEILAGLVFAIPRLQALGALMIFPITIGILLTHIFTDTGGLPMAVFLIGVNLWAIIENKEKYMPLISRKQNGVS